MRAPATSRRPHTALGRLATSVACAAVLASCAASGSEPTTAPVATIDAPADVSEPTDATIPPAASDDGVVTDADLQRFIASTESAIAGTAAEGVVFEAPEIYIAIAQSACARFSGGDDFGAVAKGLIGDLADGEPTVDDERLVGAILGSATHTICPEHGDQV